MRVTRPQRRGCLEQGAEGGGSDRAARGESKALPDGVPRARLCPCPQHGAKLCSLLLSGCLSSSSRAPGKGSAAAGQLGVRPVTAHSAGTGSLSREQTRHPSRGAPRPRSGKLPDLLFEAVCSASAGSESHPQGTLMLRGGGAGTETQQGLLWLSAPCSFRTLLQRGGTAGDRVGCATARSGTSRSPRASPRGALGEAVPETLPWPRAPPSSSAAGVPSKTGLRARQRWTATSRYEPQALTQHLEGTRGLYRQHEPRRTPPAFSYSPVRRRQFTPLCEKSAKRLFAGFQLRPPGTP